MNSEVCPFCGKTYKRLKSHLPHCKASKGFKTPPANQDVPENHTSDSQLASAPSKSTATFRTPTQTPSAGAHLQSEKIKGVSSSSSESVSADVFSLSSQSSRPSKPQKKSLREQIVAAKVEHFTKGSGEEAKSSTKKSSLGTAKGTKTKSVKGVSAPLTSTEPKPKSVSKKKKSVAHDPDVLSSHTKENRREHKARDQFWVESDGEMEETLLNPRNAHQVTVTLQDAKATLARANSRHEPGRASIWRTTDVTGNLKSHIGLDSDLSPARLPLTNQEEDAENLAAAKVQLLNSDSILTESQKTAVVRLKDAPQHSQSFQLAPPSLLTARLNEALKGRHPPDPLPTSQRLPPPSSPLLYPPAARSLCGRVEELQLKVWNQVAVAAEKQTRGAATQRRLGQVRLRELPEWLASRTPSQPRDVIEMVQKGWRWYYSRYIDVKKGGVAGVGMLLAGYCVLSYIWSYPHIKLSRWKKYH
ncbi:uncharacterized protein LOC101161774 [Oryzias latipes]|uniref:Uncharacterized protein n=1 Tax=Oryzias latipes TaxID=8090 RepID=A0A3B3H9E0_ORYLA|nr:uncharacterized protein LOC101161774 [Oryzias latipes]